MAKKTRRSQEQTEKPLVKVTVAEMVRDVMIRAMDLGQGPFYVIAFIVVIVLIRMPEDNVGKLVDQFIIGLKEKWLIGYLLSILFFSLWILSSRWQRSIHSKELDRMSKEKTELQKEKLGDNLKSSRE